ncbi:MAG: aminotransferase class V-fold PLP-dependent enzyme [Salinibacterium sp.]|nr:MAG: aminotransferase class V-fold PLP-dependent enzyme [Salinibacterium sp.]
MKNIDEFIGGFGEDPGYLDFAKAGPIGEAVLNEGNANLQLLQRARFGSETLFTSQDARMREAVASLTRFRPDQIVFQPNTSQGLMHAAFGLRGELALSAADFPSITFAATRAASALGQLTPLWLETDHGRITPGNLRDQLTSSTTAVALSLVDFRTGYLADLDGIRQVIGDRLLIVDAIQGFGVVDAPYEVADVVVAGGQKWVRAGWGTGFLAMSDRAAETLTPVFSGFSAAAESEELPLDSVPPAPRGAGAFEITFPDPLAQARFSVAMEGILGVGVPVIASRLAEKTSAVIDLADEFGIAVTSSRDYAERSGIVVVSPPRDQLTVLVASLHNHGVTVTSRGGSVRISPHLTTTEESFGMLRASFLSYASARGVHT